MPRFYVDGLDSSGKPQSVLVEVPSREEAERTITVTRALKTISIVRAAPAGRARYTLRIDVAGERKFAALEADTLDEAVERCKKNGLRPTRLHKIEPVSESRAASPQRPSAARAVVSANSPPPEPESMETAAERLDLGGGTMAEALIRGRVSLSLVTPRSLAERATQLLDGLEEVAQRTPIDEAAIDECVPGLLHSHDVPTATRLACAAGLLHAIWVALSSTKQSFELSYQPMRDVLRIIARELRRDVPHYAYNADGVPSSDIDVALMWTEDDDFFGGHAERSDVLRQVVIEFLTQLDVRNDGQLRRDFVQLHRDIIHGVVSSDGYVSSSEHVALRVSEAYAVLIEERYRALASRTDDASAAQADLQEAMEELEALVGLDSVKTEVRKFAALIHVATHRKAAGLPVSQQSLHFVFFGNPGTGKTTVARILGRIMRGYGILANGHVVETDRSGLVAEYLGQTAIKTSAKVDEAVNGILFVDEAYTLHRDVSSGDSYGQEAIDTLLKRMEDLRDRLSVIVAGYPKEMATFITSNPGLRSRFTRYIRFEDYTTEELLLIFQRMAASEQYELEPSAVDALRRRIQTMCNRRDSSFGNAREVRNLFEATVAHQAMRLASLNRPPTRTELHMINEMDFA